MKRTIVTLLAGLAIGGAALGPLTASAAEGTLSQRVTRLEYRLDTICRSARFVVDPRWMRFLENQEAC